MLHPAYSINAAKEKKSLKEEKINREEGSGLLPRLKSRVSGRITYDITTKIDKKD